MDRYLSIVELEKQFGGFTLGPVSLALAERDYLVLLGATGCGKTSLLRCIVGITGKMGHSIFLGGQDIGMLPPQRRRIGYVAQTSDLFPHLTVSQNIAFGLAYQVMTVREKQKRIDRYLDLFGLHPQKEQRVTTLSGGESKRTAMARSLIVEPAMLLLDEPLGMLDENGRQAMLRTLETIHDELQTTTIHVTHDRREAWRIAKGCAVMERGRIIETGTVTALFRKPRTRFVADFLGGTNVFDATFEGRRAHLEWTDLTLPAPVPYPRGWVMIRPELIRVGSGVGDSGMTGVVREIHDFGEYTEVDVDVSGSPEAALSGAVQLTVHVPPSAAHRVGTGRQVFLEWREEDLHPMADDDHDVVAGRNCGWNSE